MNEIQEYPVIAAFEGRIYRPKPLASGMVAQIFGENGPAADAISEMGKTRYHDAHVDVAVFQDGEEMGGFQADIRRPKPVRDGYMAQFFGRNGDDADVIAAMALSKYLDQPVSILVRLVQNADGKDMAKQPKGPYGEKAKLLFRAGFFRAPRVWKVIGADTEYLAWVRRQPCCVDGAQFGSHDGDIVPMHVRRVALGAGVAIKPEYAAIPGCWKHHQMQTDHGESAVGGRAFYDRQRIDHLERWAKASVLASLGFSSMTEVHPDLLRRWARTNGIEDLLPRQYVGS